MHHDGLPEQICLSCCKQLRDCFAFKTKCEASYETLLRIRESMQSNPSEQRKSLWRASPTLSKQQKLVKPDVSSGCRKYKNCELLELEPNEKCIQTDEVAFFACKMCDMKFVSEDTLKVR